ncbi:DUF881 domain-containing protein [Clostridium lacusfryxellense]|uniref:DUF881 domain-containing protein n=1 Tax=Clostridium lacusfryxellense TaxID=205328 RepID=UPI001C0C6FC6|nr:DUF881 domain-containing protein [Clostridium lacusfryxellense]MBU3111821.1 DUF881 domain-containing protein [Clostridium lacusfryxellense]
MKKFKSQISIGVICILLGFMITYQFKMINKQNSTVVVQPDTNTPEIITENEQLKKSKVDMQKKIDALDAKTKEYENTAGGRDEASKILNKALEETRTLTGETEVEGEGLIIYIDPKSDIFGSISDDRQSIQDSDLVHIVNELYSGGAEAICINDIRLTVRSGIRTAGNAILINDEKIIPNKRVTIKAIGKSSILYGTIKFPGAIPPDLITACDVTYEELKKVTIPKYNKTYDFEYAKPIVKKK